ncbi:hypothetical protein [Blautia marasmi]|uniref:hypothetical protein n=1 Tax=Blautia marasmi TaxID=1917868 RepID=UPI001FA8D255|nr:hypothetical protein [Blautia marasmi]
MKKPTHYLWKSDFQTQTDYLNTKRKYTDLGFRVVTYQDSQKENDIHKGLKELIKNHYANKTN